MLLDVKCLDTTGAASLEEVREDLPGKGIVLAIAAAKGPLRAMLDRTGLTQKIGAARIFSTLELAFETLTTSIHIDKEAIR